MAVPTNDSLVDKLDELAPHDREIENERIQSYWSKLDTWHLEDAALLLLGLNPDKSEIYLADTAIEKKHSEIIQVAMNCEGRSLTIENEYIINHEANIYIHVQRVNSKEFTQWAKAKGLPISEPLGSLLVQGLNQLEATSSGSDNPSNLPVKNKVSLRVEEIYNAAKEKFDNPLNIPYRGKTELREMLCDKMPNLFTTSTFDSAWKEARRENLVEVENSSQYKKGK